MLDIGWPELLVVAIVLIIVVGPKDLPPMLRAFGRTTSKLRSMASEFRGQFDEALREAELDDVKKTFDDARKLNPMQNIRDAVNPLKETGREIRSDLEKSVQTADKPAAAAKVDVPEPSMKLQDGPPAMGAPAATARASGSADSGSKPAAGSKAAAKTGKAAPKAGPKAKAASATKTSTKTGSSKAAKARTSASGKAGRTGATKSTSAGKRAAASRTPTSDAGATPAPKAAARSTSGSAGKSAAASAGKSTGAAGAKAANGKPAARARKPKSGEGAA